MSGRFLGETERQLIMKLQKTQIKHIITNFSRMITKQQQHKNNSSNLLFGSFADNRFLRKDHGFGVRNDALPLNHLL